MLLSLSLSLSQHIHPSSHECTQSLSLLLHSSLDPLCRLPYNELLKEKYLSLLTVNIHCISGDRQSMSSINFHHSTDSPAHCEVSQGERERKVLIKHRANRLNEESARERERGKKVAASDTKTMWSLEEDVKCLHCHLRQSRGGRDNDHCN